MVQQIGTEVQDPLKEKALSYVKKDCTHTVPSSRYSANARHTENEGELYLLYQSPRGRYIGTANLLHEIAGLFDRLYEFEDEAKRYWLQVWLKNKGYPQVESGKELTEKQLLELKADIIEVLST